MTKIRIICAAVALAGCSDLNAPRPEADYAHEGEWCRRVGTFHFPPSGGTITYENIGTYRDEIMDGVVFRVEVRACKATVNLPNR